MRIGPRELAIGGGALVLGAVALRSRPARARRRSTKGGGSSAPPTSEEATAFRAQLWAQLQQIPDYLIDDDQRRFALYVGYGESRWNPRAHNDSASEVAASVTAYNRIAGRFAGCNIPRARYVRGSGGRFGRLLPYFCSDLREVVPCADPDLIFDGVHDIVSLVKLAGDLQDNPTWQGTVGSLRAGWKTPGNLRPSAARLAKMRKSAVKAGLEASFIDQKIARFTKNLDAIRNALLATAVS